MDFLYIVHSYFALFISSVKNFLIFQNFLDKRDCLSLLSLFFILRINTWWRRWWRNCWNLHYKDRLEKKKNIEPGAKANPPPGRTPPKSPAGGSRIAGAPGGGIYWRLFPGSFVGGWMFAVS